MSKEAAVRGRGRPNVYSGKLKAAIVKIIQDKGLSGAMKVIKEQGVSYQPAPGKPKIEAKYGITLPTLSKLAQEAGLTFKKGRPKLDNKPAKPAKKNSVAVKELEQAVENVEPVQPEAQEVQLINNVESVESVEPEVVAEVVEVVEPVSDEVDLDLDLAALEAEISAEQEQTV